MKWKSIERDCSSRDFYLWKSPHIKTITREERTAVCVSAQEKRWPTRHRRLITIRGRHHTPGHRSKVATVIFDHVFGLEMCVHACKSVLLRQTENDWENEHVSFQRNEFLQCMKGENGCRRARKTDRYIIRQCAGRDVCRRSLLDAHPKIMKWNGGRMRKRSIQYEWEGKHTKEIYSRDLTDFILRAVTLPLYQVIMK